jgi:hypothetical protein
MSEKKRFREKLAKHNISNFSPGAIAMPSLEERNSSWGSCLTFSKNASIKLNYCNSLIEYLLKSGKTIRIRIKGYCSPLASTDYNKNLAKRRINSLVNELKNYNQGSLIKYLDSNHLIIVEEELGESDEELNDLSKLSLTGGSSKIRNLSKLTNNKSTKLQTIEEISNLTETPTNNQSEKYLVVAFDTKLRLLLLFQIQ